MNVFITPTHLTDLGIDLPEPEQHTLLETLNETLEERVGEEITDSLSDEKLEELLRLQDTASEEELGTWLEQNVPNLNEIIQQEIDIILGDLADKAGTISPDEA